MVELPMKPYIFVKKLMVIEKIFDVFSVIVEAVVSLKLTKVVLSLLGARIKDVEGPYKDREDRNDSHDTRFFSCAFVFQNEI